MSSSSERRRKVYVAGYSSRDDEHDIKKAFKKYGKIEEVSWKGRFCFVVRIYNIIPRPLEIVRTQREPYVRCIRSHSMVIHWSSSLPALEEQMMDHATIAIKKDTCK